MDIKQALSLGERSVVSLVGAGGKTSLMYSLAHELCSEGKKVLTTTTTRIFMPTEKESPVTIVEESTEKIIEKARALTRDNNHITLGTEYLSAQGKLAGALPEVLESIHETNIFDYLVIEADGAARRSLKACSADEPVVPRFSDSIISLVGLDVIGKPLEEQWVFRSKLFSTITNLSLKQKITAASVAKILIHDMASIDIGKKDVLKVVFLNKADKNELIEVAEEVAASLETLDPTIFNRVIIGELQDTPAIHRCRTLA